MLLYAWSALAAPSLDVTVTWDGETMSHRGVADGVLKAGDGVTVGITGVEAPACVEGDLATCSVTLTFEVCRPGRRKPVCGTQTRDLTTSHRTGFGYGSAPKEAFVPVAGTFEQGGHFAIEVRWADPVRTHWAAWTRKVATEEAYRGFLDRYVDECAAFRDEDCAAFEAALGR